MFRTVSWIKGATSFGLWELFSQFSCILCHENQSKQVEPQLRVFKLMSGSNFLYNRWIVSVIFRAKYQTFFAYSSFLTVQICCFSSSCLTVNEEFLCFWLLVEQKENLEEVTLGSGRFFHCFLAFYRRNGWSINHEDQSYAKPLSTGGEYLWFPDFSCSTPILYLDSLIFGWTSRSATTSL